MCSWGCALCACLVYATSTVPTRVTSHSPPTQIRPHEGKTLLMSRHLYFFFSLRHSILRNTNTALQQHSRRSEINGIPLVRWYSGRVKALARSSVSCTRYQVPVHVHVHVFFFFVVHLPYESVSCIFIAYESTADGVTIISIRGDRNTDVCRAYIYCAVDY